MEDVQQPAAGPRRWLAPLGWMTLGAIGGAAFLVVLAAAIPGDLPSWVGYAIAAVCFGFVYVWILLTLRARRAERRSTRAE